MIITINKKVECRITSGAYDYGEYYLGSVRFYERFQGDKQWLYTVRTNIKRLTAADAQSDAVQLMKDILDTNNTPYCGEISVS